MSARGPQLALGQANEGKVVMESIIETKAAMVVDFFTGLRGTVHVTFEEGIHAAWLYYRVYVKTMRCGRPSTPPLRGDAQGERKKERRQANPVRAERWCYGKTPLQTFVDSIPLAKEKLLAA